MSNAVYEIDRADALGKRVQPASKRIVYVVSTMSSIRLVDRLDVRVNFCGDHLCHVVLKYFLASQDKTHLRIARLPEVFLLRPVNHSQTHEPHSFVEEVVANIVENVSVDVALRV